MTDRSLSTYHLPALSFAARPGLPESLAPIWADLRAGRTEAARRGALAELREVPAGAGEDRAALLLALSAAEHRLGRSDAARRYAEGSLNLCGRQHAAHRVLLALFAAEQDYESAYLYLSTLAPPASVAPWDEAMDATERHVALAAWAWATSAWKEARLHVEKAFPGLDGARPALLGDIFRLALYRDDAADAAAVAARLLPVGPPEAADPVLQAMVQKGWTAEALPLYRTLHEAAPESALLRRRLVGLCLKEGQLEEARRLAAPGALVLAA